MHTLPLNQALSIFEENLPEIRQACIENAEEVIKQNSPYAIQSVDEPFTAENIMLHLNYMRIQEQTARLFKTVRRIDSYRHFKNNPSPTGGVTDLDIQTAREVSADWFIYEANLSTRKPHVGICPFHIDKTPSLTLMKSKRTGNLYLKCFPCGEAFDSIGFIMKRDNIDFMEAVKKIVT